VIARPPRVRYSLCAGSAKAVLFMGSSWAPLTKLAEGTPHRTQKTPAAAWRPLAIGWNKNRAGHLLPGGPPELCWAVRGAHGRLKTMAAGRGQGRGGYCGSSGHWALSPFRRPKGPHCERSEASQSRIRDFWIASAAPWASAETSSPEPVIRLAGGETRWAPRNDGVMAFRSRDTICPSHAVQIGPLHREGAGKAGSSPLPWPACERKCTRRLPQVRPRHPGPPCAMVLTLIRALLGDRLSCPRPATMLRIIASATMLMHCAGHQHRDARTTRFHVRAMPFVGM
jgi:hypothetical protein